MAVPGADRGHRDCARLGSLWRTRVYPRATWKVPNLGFVYERYRPAAQSTPLTTYLKTIPTTGLVVTVHGRVPASYGDPPRRADWPRRGAESVLSMLYGNGCDTGPHH
jgi:hypothetical protein